MADREKVIKGLECIDMPSDECLIDNCPYEKFGPALCLQQIVKDALSLLKEQQSAYERGKRDGVSQYLREREEDEEYEY